MSFTSRLLLNCQWHFISWSEPLCHASAVHHGKIKHTARPGPAWKKTEQNRAHIQAWWSLRNSIWQEQQKPPRNPGGSTAFCTRFVPLPKTTRSPSCVYSFEKKGEALWAAAVMAAAESSSHQGAGRGREQMLISGWSLRIVKGYI